MRDTHTGNPETPDSPGRESPVRYERHPGPQPDPSPQDRPAARLRTLARQAPPDPGVYVMKDGEGSIIYVGKAKNLRNRLSSYFTGRKEAKTRHLVSHLDEIEWILAGSEYEALLLENNLIKRHSPRYNINLKDGKTYPCIRITNEEFPRIFRTRRILRDGSLYFGPFPGAGTIDTYLDLIRRIFPLRRCMKMRPREHPCTYYHIGRCPGPCAGMISREEYRRRVDQITKLLSGKTGSLVKDLRARMRRAARDLKFEEASRLRDALKAVESFEGSSNSVDFDPSARDYIAWAADGELITFVVFGMRDGKLTERDLFRSRHYSTEDDALQNFILEYYDRTRPPPPVVYLQTATDRETLERYFRDELGAVAEIRIPAEARHESAIRLAARNAAEDVGKRRRDSGDTAALVDLRERLGLSSLPRRIEGFDIAQLAGKDTVASLVVFENGVPDRKRYRHFRIRSLGGAIDDFGAMREAVGRRYTGLLNEGADPPDFILVDGGAGQVSAAREILEALGLECDLAGLAKRDELVYLPGRAEPVGLPGDSPALRLLVAVRDETHRFATGLSRRLRAKTLAFESLESVPGIGPARARRLMHAFGSIGAVAEADAAAFAKAGGMGLRTAESMLASLRGETPDASSGQERAGEGSETGTVAGTGRKARKPRRAPAAAPADAPPSGTPPADPAPAGTGHDDSGQAEGPDPRLPDNASPAESPEGMPIPRDPEAPG